MIFFADEAVERMVLASREPSPPLTVAQLRRAAADRAHLRPAGPAMPAADRLVAGVPVRVYDQQSTRRIVYLHGGGFVLGDLGTHDALCRRLAAATATSVVAVDYRRAPEHPFPAAVHDATAVLEWAAAHGPVAVAGDSAGAFVAVQALLATRVAVTAQLLTCPLADLTLSGPSATQRGTGFVLDVPELREWVSWWAPELPAVPDPLDLDLSALPPALVVTAEHDPLRDGGDRYAMRLRAAGVAVVHRVEPGLVHNFATYTHQSPAAAAADARFLADARRMLG